jgi:hypothetical protein
MSSPLFSPQQPRNYFLRPVLKNHHRRVTQASFDVVMHLAHGSVIPWLLKTKALASVLQLRTGDLSQCLFQCVCGLQGRFLSRNLSSLSVGHSARVADSLVNSPPPPTVHVWVAMTAMISLLLR